MIELIKVKTLKTFTYTYNNSEEMETHKANMLNIETEDSKELKITFSQTIKES